MNHQRMRWISLLVAVILPTLALLGCSFLPFAPTPPQPNVMVYDAPVALTIKKDNLLPGTTIAYGGKLPTGSAKVMIAGLAAPKQVADTLDWQGTPVPNIAVKLTTRVVSFDDQALNLAGTAHIEIQGVTVQPGGSPGNAQMEFSAPVTFSLAKSGGIPGSNILYDGAAPEGAKFLGIEGYPYRKTLDSLQYNGRLAPKVFLRLDLRVISFSDTGAAVGGTANIIVEQ